MTTEQESSKSGKKKKTSQEQQVQGYSRNSSSVPGTIGFISNKVPVQRDPFEDPDNPSVHDAERRLDNQ